jgi:hypothetical protein
MSDHDNLLPFPSDEEEDAMLAEHVATSYKSFPARPISDAMRCARAVLAEAASQAGWRAALPRQRWWWGAAAAAVLVAVTMRPWRPDAVQHDSDAALDSAVNAVRAAQPSGAITPVAGGDVVRFDLTLPAGAQGVALVGDFNGWDERATPMLRRQGKGVWTAQVELPPGRHVYAFVIDGQKWLVDPLAPQVPDAGFGPANAVVIEAPR